MKGIENCIKEYELDINKFTEYSKVGKFHELKSEAYKKWDEIRSDNSQTREDKLYNILCYFQNKTISVKQSKENILSIVIPIEILLLTLIFGSGILKDIPEELKSPVGVILGIVSIVILLKLIAKAYPWKEEYYYSYYDKLIEEYMEENREYTIMEFKIKREVLDKFERRCKKIERSPSEKIIELMCAFIEEINNEEASE